MLDEDPSQPTAPQWRECIVCGVRRRTRLVDEPYVCRACREHQEVADWLKRAFADEPETIVLPLWAAERLADILTPLRPQALDAEQDG